MSHYCRPKELGALASWQAMRPTTTHHECLALCRCRRRPRLMQFERCSVLPCAFTCAARSNSLNFINILFVYIPDRLFLVFIWARMEQGRWAGLSSNSCGFEDCSIIVCWIWGFSGVVHVGALLADVPLDAARSHGVHALRTTPAI